MFILTDSREDQGTQDQRVYRYESPTALAKATTVVNGNAVVIATQLKMMCLMAEMKDTLLFLRVHKVPREPPETKGTA